MFENLKNGFKTANATRKLVFSDKQLFLYPILSVIIAIIAAILIIALGVIAFIALGTGATTLEMAIVFVVFFFILVFVVTLITTYMTMAMLIAFREHNKGKGNAISFGEALRRTNPYDVLIVKWAFFYSVVYMIIHTIELAIQRALSRGIGGAIISDLITGGLNLALAAAIAFALPVILDEKKGPIDTLKSSASFILKNFGNTFGGLLFTELFYLIFVVIGIILIAVALLLLPSTALGGALAIGLIATGIILIIVGALLRYVLFNCFKLIVYEYKTKKVLPKGFDAKLIDSSIKQKGNSKGNPPRPTPFSVGMGQQGGL